MANLLATMGHAQPGDELICGHAMHTVAAEGGGAARFAGVSTRTIREREGRMDPVEIAAAIRSDDPHYPRTALIWVEQPYKGWVVPLDNLAAINDLARSRNLPIHMDGARIFNAAVALRMPVKDIARYADSVMFCISKGLSAPVGSLLLGSANFVARVRRARKALGGGMRQSGFLAAAGLFALDTMVDRLADDHRNARRLADGLKTLGWKVDRDAPQTNIFMVEAPNAALHAHMASRLREHGVLILCSERTASVRLVTHYGIDTSDIDRALEAFAAVSA
jgi:threonine aldolase